MYQKYRCAAENRNDYLEGLLISVAISKTLPLPITVLGQIYRSEEASGLKQIINLSLYNHLDVENLRDKA